MFYYLNGNLTYRDINSCVIDCNGVGYKLTISSITSDLLSSKEGEKVKLYTYMAVREDGIELFGFISNEERSCFNRLISVSGVGPKAAISILSTLTPQKFSVAVCSEDTKTISKAQGIGAKTAARIILELKDKISSDIPVLDLPHLSSSQTKTSQSSSAMTEAAEALMVLGYDKSQVLNVLSRVDANQKDSGEIIKAALKLLAF